jgi:alpha-beta hydrolase superfamily lysophospholipase
MTTMIHEEGTFSGFGGLSLYHQRWLPEGAARAVLLIAHGYAEHSGRYGHVVEYFVPRGYAVWAVDHRGHGRSEGERVAIDSFDDYVTDLRTYFELVRVANAGLPVYLIGHSMGSWIAIAYAAKYQADLTGLILSGGGIGTGRRPASAGSSQVDLSITLSRDPAVGEAYRNDPLVFQGPPPEGRRAAMAAFWEELPGMTQAITLPVLVVAGADSPLGDGPGSQRLFEALSSQDKTLKLYDGLLHEIFNEPEREQVFADIESWLAKH